MVMRIIILMMGKPPNQILFIFLTLLSNLMSVSLSLEEDEGNVKSASTHSLHEFVAGQTMEKLPDPIFYDTYIPIIYKIPIPKHTEKALTLVWGEANKCNDSTFVSGSLCPMSYHLSKVIKKLGDDMGFWKPYYVNHTSTKGEAFKKRTGYEVVCNEISQHFFRSYTSKSQLDSYMIALKACSRLHFQKDFRIPNENWVANKNVYYEMMQSFKFQYFSDLPSKGKVDWAITQNAYISVHGLLLTNLVMESVRLATAHRICQSGLIPETFITMSMLKEALQGIQADLSSKYYQLVYKNLMQDIEEYYKLPLADCTFSDDYSFIIRILVPIRRTEITHTLVEINTIPFLEELPKDSGIPTRLCRLKLSAPKFTLIESSTGLLLDTRCESNELCKTSEVSTIFENDACTVSLLSDDRQLITNTCKFSCFSVSPAALPLIQRVSSDTYVAVGRSDTKINLHCFNKPKEFIPIELKNIGALRIKLACKCQLLYSNHVSYRPRHPCGSTTEVKHILPYHWYNSKLNLTSLEKSDKYEQSDSSSQSTTKSSNSALGTENQSFYESSTIPINNYNSISTSTESAEDIDDSQIETSLEKQEGELEKQFQLPEKHGIVVRKLQEIPTGLLVQLCMLWAIIVILLVIVFMLAFYVRRLLKWKELQAYKETRVLYRPAEESNKIGRTGSSGVRVAWESFYDLFTVH